MRQRVLREIVKQAFVWPMVMSMVLFGVPTQDLAHGVVRDVQIIPPTGETGIFTIQALEGMRAQAAAFDATQAADDSEKKLPHEGDRPRQIEHLAAFELVKHGTETIIAQQTGNWGDLATWGGMKLPGFGERVLIPKGVKVTVDGVYDTPLFWVRVDGTLEWMTTVDTALRVDTMVVDPKGTFIMGTENDRVRADVTAILSFVALDKFFEPLVGESGFKDWMYARAFWDPRGLGGGLIHHGDFKAYGALKTSHVQALGTLKRGDTTFTLASTPTGWQVGDRLVLTGDYYGRHDEVELTSITLNDDGTAELTVHSDETSHGGLKYNHEILTYVGNATRNVRLVSEAVHEEDFEGDPGDDGPGHFNEKRAHVMFMHTRKVVADGVGFYGLGRTDKQRQLDLPIITTETFVNPDTGEEFEREVRQERWEITYKRDDRGRLILDENRQPIEVSRKRVLSGSNSKGRYSVHFHRNGVDREKNPNPAIIRNSAIVGSPGWGLVNHDSFVIAEHNVTFDIKGAHLVAEAGPEIGRYADNFSVFASASRSGGVEGFARRGNGLDNFGRGEVIWLQGPGIDVINNVISGGRATGITAFTRALDQGGTVRKEKFLASNLRDPSWAKGAKEVAVGDGTLLIDGNIITGTRTALETWFHLLGVKDDEGGLRRSHIQNNRYLNVKHGQFNPYTNFTTFENNEIVGRSYNSGVAFSGNNVTRNIIYRNNSVDKMKYGISMPSKGHNIVEGGEFKVGFAAISIGNARSTSRLVEINDSPDGTPIQFLIPEPGQARWEVPWKIYVRFRESFRYGQFFKLFGPDVILLNLGDVLLNGKQLYYLQQKADHVIMWTGVPELDGLTNTELNELFGWAVAGTIAPDDAEQVDPRINALVGPRVTYKPRIDLRSRRYVHPDRFPEGYKLVVRKNANRETITEEGIELRQTDGWQLITREIDGELYTFPIYRDTVAPIFELSKKQVLRINTRDLKKGLKITGKLLDASWGIGGELGSKKFKKTFKNLDKLPIAGDNTITLVFKTFDWTGVNFDLVSLRIVVDPDFERVNVLPGHRLRAAPIIATETVKALVPIFRGFAGNWASSFMFSLMRAFGFGGSMAFAENFQLGGQREGEDK